MPLRKILKNDFCVFFIPTIYNNFKRRKICLWFRIIFDKFINQIMYKNKKYTVAGLFSGCGGLDLGFINAGFDVIWANDFFKEAVETYRKNIGNHIVLGDITKIPSSEIPNNFDVLLGGFPCQGFYLGGRPDSNRRPPEPQSGVLTN
jgi:hypothetical protein